MSTTPTSEATNGAESISERTRGLRRRLLADAIARWVVTAGGLATVLSILAILTFIAIEVVPLWKSARVSLASEFRLERELRLPVLDDSRGVLVGLGSGDALEVYRVGDGHLLQTLPLPELVGQSVVAAARARDALLFATAEGKLFGERLVFDKRRSEGVVTPPAVSVKPVGEWNLGAAPRVLATSAPGDRGVVAVFATTAAGAFVYASVEKKNVFGAVQRSEVRQALETAGEVTAVAVNASGTRAYLGTAAGKLDLWDVSDPEEPARIASAQATHAAVTALTYLIGDTSVVVGDAGGGVNVWFPIRDGGAESGWRLELVHPFPPQGAAVTAIAVSPRDRSFLTGDANGEVVLRHATTQRQLAKPVKVAGSVASLVYAPKANGGVAIAKSGDVADWDIVNPHPEVTLGALFGKVWYDGYPEPAYVWQSTGGTDEFEPKLSLRPLIFGTMKGTFYALLFAVPLAVLAALYTSQFAHPKMRNVVKPIVEVMAALPSVVLGFLAGLWLAPAIENHVAAILTMFVIGPVGVIVACVAYKSLPRNVRARVPGGLEVVLLVPIVVGLAMLSWSLNGQVEQLLFGGDFRAWVLQTAGLTFDQRNCLVVGFAMGFAVIPIIFTISEDALANVPPRLVSASLALGATPWQTAIRVVMPTASPGIFSAIMIGFGRAVGETMIVLMATGNTPLMDWNIFNGMRTLSANIAVEIPEAPFGGTLYRVLFLAALLLFFATFLVNTIAEVVRQRLRRRYQEL